jgi:hypothetical protein
MSGTIQRDNYELPNFNTRRRPASTGDAAIDPVDTAIRTGDLRDICCTKL